MNRRLLLLGLLLALLATLAFGAEPMTHDTPNTLSPAEQAAGWQLLFDGRSLEGWRASDAHPPGAC